MKMMMETELNLELNYPLANQVENLNSATVLTDVSDLNLINAEFPGFNHMSQFATASIMLAAIILAVKKNMREK